MKFGLLALALGAGAVTAANVLLVARHHELREELTLARQGAGSIPRLAGFELDGRRWTSAAAPCHLLRLTMDDCPHCKADQALYAQLLAVAQERKCELIELSPRDGGMAAQPGRGVVQLRHVDQDLGPAVYPYGTPHTLLLDDSWSIRWQRRGELRQDELAQGIVALRKLSL